MKAIKAQELMENLTNKTFSHNTISESHFFRVHVRVDVCVQLFRKGPVNHKSRKSECRSRVNAHKNYSFMIFSSYSKILMQVE